MSTKMKSTEVDYKPLCPHCEEQIDELHWRPIRAINAEYLYTCPHCPKIIGIGVPQAAWLNQALAADEL